MNAAQSEQSTTQRFFTTRFGEIEILASEIITVPEGLLGFNQIHRYVLLKDPDQAPFLWFQALDDPDLAFVVVDPFIFFPGYEVQVKPWEIASIQLEDLAQATVLTIVTIPPDPTELTTNLRGPLVLNSEKNLGKQLVLIDDRYHTKHFLLKDIPPDLATPPAEESTHQKKQPPLSGNHE